MTESERDQKKCAGNRTDIAWPDTDRSEKMEVNVRTTGLLLTGLTGMIFGT